MNFIQNHPAEAVIISFALFIVALILVSKFGIPPEIKNKKPHLIIDRRLAIAEALKIAPKGSAVLITGKGTDPYIMRAGGQKEPWSDAQVATEEITKISV